MQYEIKDRYDSTRIIYAGEYDSLKACVEAAVKSSADLRSADLRYADLRYADLSSANLRSANLSSANLSYADLRYANLSSADGIVPERVSPMHLLRHQPGKIRLYKLVTATGESPYARENGYTPIIYRIGETYSVVNPNTDCDTLCGAGINVASLDWCLREWQAGYRIMLVEFTAKDIACIPTATDGKVRLSKCKVLRELDLTPYVASPKDA